MSGLVFPPQSDGSTSTTQSGARILSAALEVLDPAAARATTWEKRWRRNYPKHFRKLVAAAIEQPAAVVKSAQAGLDAAWKEMRFAADGKLLSLTELWNQQHFSDGPNPTAPTLLTKTIQGRGRPAPTPWGVPYKGQFLQGQALQKQLLTWEKEGIIESSAAQALSNCSIRGEWFDLSDRHLVLLGAGSEAGPLRWLAKWRSRVIAVDIARPAIWTKIESLIANGNATLHAPVLPEHSERLAKQSLPGAGNYWTDFAGADLLLHLPEIARWVRSFSGPLDVAAHAYLDGERHVRVAMAMDFVQRAACINRPDTSLGFMATPTDIFAVPEEAAMAAAEAYAARSIISRTTQTPLRLASGDRFFQPNVEGLIHAPGYQGQAGKRYGIIDSMVIEQGPNYALAKRIQQWRALTAHAQGHRVSLNVAPSTATTSVTKNPALAAGFAGADSFGIEIFEPETTNAIIAALWVRDLRDESAHANPNKQLSHPLELFMDNAAHGGLWRSAYLPRSALPFAAALGWVRQRLG